MQGPTFRTGVEVLAVDVTVLDDRGRPVIDLRAPEFVVKIDGQPRRVVSAEYIRIDVEEARRAAAEPVEAAFTTNVGPPTGRQIVLVVDQGNIRLGGARPILATAARFLDRLSPLDRVAFLAVPEPGPAVDFTDDPARIRAAMRSVAGTWSKFEGKFNIGMSEADAIVNRMDLARLQEVVRRECAPDGSSAIVVERCEREVEMEATEMVQSLRERTQGFLRGLQDLLRQLTVVEGQKSLILISEGLNIEEPGVVDDLATLAAVARVSISVLLLDTPRFDAAESRLSPTLDDDRRAREEGLEQLAGFSRGELFRVVGTGDAIFERLLTEMSGYYLLGVEQALADRDGKRHRIEVEVRRRGTTLRSRRAFVMPEVGGKRTAETILATALRSPMAVAELPLRVTTYANQDPSGGRVGVFIAADVGQPGMPAGDFTVGFAIVDAEGRVAASGIEKKRLAPADGRPDAPLAYSAVVALDPGSYTLRFGVVDAEGRRGTVLRPLAAWQMTGQEFSVGDLVVANGSDRTNERIVPAVEARVYDGRVAAYLNVHADAPATFDQTAVTIDVASDETSGAIVSAPAQLVAGSNPAMRVAYALVPVQALPAGRYLARATITREGKPAGQLSRPFVIVAAASNGGGGTPTAVALPASLFSPPPAFDLKQALQPGVLGALLDGLEQSTPALAPSVAQARAGQYRTGAIGALEAGHQQAALFLQGLDLLRQGQVEKAAAQLSLAAGPRRDFYPAAFYLGSCYAASGRDRDAAGVWQQAIGTAARPPVVYALLADARFRAGQPTAVIELLQSAHARWPDDDEIARRLGLALVLSGRYAEASAALDGYVSRHPADQDALLAAIIALHPSNTGRALEGGERLKLDRWAAAYRGPQRALVARYVEALR